MDEPNLRRAAWDSDFFKKEIAFATDANCLESDFACFDLIWTKIPTNNPALIDRFSQQGFKYVEGEISFSKNIARHKNKEKISTAGIEHLGELSEIVSNLYQYSRYRPPWFSEEQKERFYKKWVENAVHRKFDDACIVNSSDNGSIRGFITISVSKSSARVGLIGVSKRFQQQGVARQLLDQAGKYAENNNCTTLNIATQTSNITALNLYIKSGFIMKSSDIWLYKTSRL